MNPVQLFADYAKLYFFIIVLTWNRASQGFLWVGFHDWYGVIIFWLLHRRLGIDYHRLSRVLVFKVFYSYSLPWHGAAPCRTPAMDPLELDLHACTLTRLYKVPSNRGRRRPNYRAHDFAHVAGRPALIAAELYNIQRGFRVLVLTCNAWISTILPRKFVFIWVVRVFRCRFTYLTLVRCLRLELAAFLKVACFHHEVPVYGILKHVFAVVDIQTLHKCLAWAYRPCDDVFYFCPVLQLE